MRHGNQKAAAAHRRWRRIKDQLARYGVGIGGVGVIAAVVLILLYLFWAVAPLFLPASAESLASYKAPPQEETAYLAIEEQAELAFRLTRSGQAIFFATPTGETRELIDLELGQRRITSAADGNRATGALALGLSDGSVLLLTHTYPATFKGSERTINPRIAFPYGRTPIRIGAGGQPITDLAYVDGEERFTLAAVTADQQLRVRVFMKQESFLTGEITLEPRDVSLDITGTELLEVELSGNQRWLYVAGLDGSLSFFEIRPTNTARLIERNPAVENVSRITTMRMLTGGISLLMGTEDGRILQFFPVRDSENRYRLEHIRTFDGQDSPITVIASEQRRKGFAAADASGRVGLYYASSGSTVSILELSENALSGLALAPRSNAMLAQSSYGTLQYWSLHNEHPEATWSGLWGRIWYESYEEPRFIWQSSAATSDFEPKFSLTPLTFGTLKASFYAMLFAVPLALMGAIYTANFMTGSLRRVVKPTIEIMAALPTVILGFLAGLWLAPYIEDNLAGILSVLLLLPFGVLAFAWVWTRMVPRPVRNLVPEGWDAALLVPVLVLVAWIAHALGGVFENLMFGGNMRTWLTTELGIGYDQRNALVVGIAMGVAVIPTIFSIAEDAIFGVPRSLSHGSLALGATPWDTLMRVVLPTASPGIFSALMIGLGRAVGETMIVLMATGNTPVMDLSIFEGMRTLSANIAVEMPESELNSTHYRVLFLAALVLFAFTFLVNTGAEVIRQRLRRKYSSL